MKAYRNILADENGIALMLVLWVMVFLSIIVTEFAFSMRSEMNITRNFKEETQSYYLARAGIALALVEILNSETNPDIKGGYIKDDKFIFKHKNKEGEADYLDDDAQVAFIPQRQNIPLGAGTVSYEITDEQSKININGLMTGRDSDKDLVHRLLYDAAGIQMGTERDIMVDSILDWMDSDDLHKLNGAEDDYYQGLDTPYDCKDGPFDTVDELLLVRGITKKILYGSKSQGSGIKEDPLESEQVKEDSGSYPGLAKFITVWGGNRFNNYTANAATMKIKYGEDLADSIYNATQDKLENPDFSPPKSSCYSIKATGKLGDGSASRTIFAVVRITKKNNIPNILYKCWNDNSVEYQFVTEQQE